MSKFIRSSLLVSVIALSFGDQARAQTPPFSLDNTFVYSVQVACTTSVIPIGIITSVSAAGELVAGVREELSRTRVTLQNPLDRSVRITYRAVQPRTGATPGGTFGPVSETLETFAARSLDCGDFITLQQNQPAAGLLPATEGFLVIESRTRLQVAAVYTQRVVKEGLKDDVSSDGLLAGKKNVFRGGQIPDNEVIPLTPLPVGPPTSPIQEEWSASGPGKASASTSQLATATPAPLTIPIEKYGNGPVEAAAMGVGVGVGVGRGIGLGIGAGGGIDVEYIEPMIVPRRLVLTTQPRTDG